MCFDEHTSNFASIWRNSQHERIRDIAEEWA